MSTLADLRRRLAPWQLRLLDIGLPLVCALAALMFHRGSAAGWLFVDALLIAALFLALRLRRLPMPRVPGSRSRWASGWPLWLLDAGLALALILATAELAPDLAPEWWYFGVPLVAGVLIQHRWPLPAVVLAGIGFAAHLGFGSTRPLDLALPITVYTLASRTGRRRTAIATVGVLLIGVFAVSTIAALTAEPEHQDYPGEAAMIDCIQGEEPRAKLACLPPDRWSARDEGTAAAPQRPITGCLPEELADPHLGCVPPEKRAAVERIRAKRAAAGDIIVGGFGGPVPTEPTAWERMTDGLMTGFGHALLPMLVLGLALAFGDSVRSRRAHLDTLEQRAEDLEREQHQRMALAAAAERARITRELHDVVAHGMSVMVVQAQGGAAALRRHPDRTATALQNVITTGRTSLAEMRRLLGVVSRDPTDDPALAPQPGMGALPALVDQVRAAGTPVRLSIEGLPVPLPASVDLSAYRIAQEALTNTLKHAGPAATAEVRLGFAPGWLEIEVSDDGVGEPADGVGEPAHGDRAGNGLRGIAERVAMLGGELAVGPGPDGGFRVWALLPFQSADPA